MPEPLPDESVSEEEEDAGWVCSCGDWIKGDYRCPGCGGSPLWGGCDDDEEYDPEDDESWMDEIS